MAADKVPAVRRSHVSDGSFVSDTVHRDDNPGDTERSIWESLP